VEVITVNLEDDFIKFSVNGKLEKYRVESLFDKEPETIKWIENSILSSDIAKPVFFDIGANIGIYSLYAGALNPLSNIYSFEPSSANFQSLLRNIQANSFENIHANYFAVSSKSEYTKLYISDTRPGNSGAQINEPINENGEKFNAEEVNSVLKVSIQDLKEFFAFPTPNYIKIDVDGHEHEILSSILPCLKHNMFKSMLVEFNSEESLKYWTTEFLKFGIYRDDKYENIKNHSSVRRGKNGGKAKNVVFSKRS